LIGIPKGAFMFFTDIVRAVEVPLTLDFIVASSYMKSIMGEVKIYYDKGDISDNNVLLIDDIVIPASLNHIRGFLKVPGVLRYARFWTRKRDGGRNSIDYVGFEIPNEYVVGYGLDYDNKFEISYISISKKKHNGENVQLMMSIFGCIN
jgi:hypoxanthine phosphoribosyltransferase